MTIVPGPAAHELIVVRHPGSQFVVRVAGCQVVLAAFDFQYCTVGAPMLMGVDTGKSKENPEVAPPAKLLKWETSNMNCWVVPFVRL